LEDNAQAFFDSLFTDLEPEDRAALIRDWTEHGVIIIENVDGQPMRRDPADHGPDPDPDNNWTCAKGDTMTKKSKKTDEPFMSNLDVAQSVDLVRSARRIADDLASEGRFDDANDIRALVNDYIREKALPMG